MADPRKTLAPIKKLLLTKESDSIKQGVELLRSLDDPSLFDTLLSGVRWTCEQPKPGAPPTFGVLETGGFCGTAANTGRWDIVVALALVAAAPPESKAAAQIIASTTSLQLNLGGDYRQRFALDLTPVAAFTSLERLHVVCSAPPQNLEAITRLPRLTHLELVGAIEDLTRLSGCASLSNLRVNSSALAKPGVLRDVPALRELSVENSYHLATLDVLRELPQLERLRLSLHACHGDFSPLGQLVNLKRLHVDNGSASFTSVEPLTACTELEELYLERCGSITTLAPLEGLRKLRVLSVDGCGKLEHLGLEGVTSLKVFSARWAAVKEIDCLAGCALESVSLDSMNRLARLDGLRSTTTIRELRFSTSELTSLSGVEGCVDLQHISARAAPNLTSLTGLANARHLTHITLPDCKALTSLDGIGGCEELTWLVIEGGAFSDISLLSNMKSLEFLSLRGCSKVTDISPVASLPKLRAMVLSGTGVDRSKVPQHLKHVTSFAQDADLQKLAAKPPPEPRGPVIPTAIGADHRKAWTQIKKLLLTRDPEMIDQGVELVRALDDASIFAELLKGVTWVAPDRSHPNGEVKLEGTWFEDTEPARPFRIRAVLALCAAASADCEPANALKASLKMLSFNGKTDPKRPCPFDVAPLAAFHALERLEVVSVPELAHPEALSRLTSLASLFLRGVGPWSGVDFSAMKSLRTVAFHDVSLQAVSTLRDAPALAAVTLSGVRGAGAISLDGSATLESFNLSSSAEPRSISVRDCAALRDVQIQWCQTIECIDLRGCAALSNLSVPSCRALREVRGLGELRALKALSAPYASSAWLPTEPVAGLEQLYSLDLSGTDLTELSRVANFSTLRALTAGSSAALTDVSALATMTHLRSLSIPWSGVTDLMPLEGMALNSINLKGTKVPPDRVPLALRRFVK